ncbi:MAG: DEAD/DEAH box helicase, partial [Betaproteobacteria bacterium]|nr:DEAD/DEAH box helicase [Betaproteobacteria bacterium]
FIKIEYAEGQILWLPAAHMHLLSPHFGASEPAKLGGKKWKRARARAEQAARDAAAELLDIQARRAAAPGISHRPDAAAMAQFAGGFPHEETPDQAAAVRDVLADMQTARPMDRLIAADVGFGKTEVALRAVCACVLSGRQAAVLAPTTLLAEQHARNFADRFAALPVRIATLTRMRVGRERTEDLAAIADGRAGIVIGAHALLQTKTRFHKLGLAVIDEEHRFGVRQKEYFKSLRANADVLSMSATPIPRTMALAMKGLRDISIISTPPPARLAVHTVVAPFSRGAIIDACEREMLRGGRIYFVHNDIRGLPALAEQLREWVPAMKIGVAHGSMDAPSVERAMRDFIRGGNDMLLATTIVESGLDIAAANTIIINRADCMGAARLHQLRGRVGRGGAQAYAYFLIPADGAAAKKGKKRLDDVAAHGALGDGWRLAIRDLETRGAGEILGERQSGEVAAVGYAMYQKMLNAAVRQLAGGADAPDIETVVELPAPALLPSAYVHSAGERLRYYRLLAAGKTDAEIDAVKMEWQDRFGAPPEEALTLIASHKLRLLATAVQAVKLRASSGAATVEFQENPKCREILLQKIGKGICIPGKDGNTVLVKNLSALPAECAAQLASFLRSLAEIK